MLIKKRNEFFCKNTYHNAVNHVLNFQLSAKLSSFFGAVFPSLLWSNFFWDTQYKWLALILADKAFTLLSWHQSPATATRYFSTATWLELTCNVNDVRQSGMSEITRKREAKEREKLRLRKRVKSGIAWGKVL